MKRQINRIALCLVLGFFTLQIHAADYMKDYKNRITVGGFFLTKYESEVSLADNDAGLGVMVSPRDALGVKSEDSVFRLDGHYRFNKNHSLIYSWYRINSTGSRNIDREIPWEPEPIPVGAKVETEFTTNLYKVGYMWSFYNNNEVELGIGLGLHITQLKMRLEAETTGTPLETEDVDTTLPLPVVMFGLGYNISPKLKLTYLSQVFGLNYEGINGTYVDQTLQIEYRFWEHVGLGLGINGMSLSVKKEEADRTIRFNNRLTGGMLNLSVYF